jgi:hypothetical protein
VREGASGHGQGTDTTKGEWAAVSRCSPALLPACVPAASFNGAEVTRARCGRQDAGSEEHRLPLCGRERTGVASSSYVFVPVVRRLERDGRRSRLAAQDVGRAKRLV